MRRIAAGAAVPIIETIKKGTAFEVHWDYQEAPESAVLFKHQDYLRGYIDGTLGALGIRPSKICCASGLTGAIKRLSQDQAKGLHSALDRVLIPMVTDEFTRLKKIGDLPHLRLFANDEV